MVRSLVFVGILVSVCACAEVASVQPPTAEAQEAAVYAAVLDSVYGEAGEREITVQDSTTSLPAAGPASPDSEAIRFAGYHRRELAGLQPTTERAFFGAPRPARALPLVLPTRVRVEWVTPMAVDSLRSAAALDRGVAFRSITRLSPVAFSDDSLQALVYLSEACVALCGHGEYVLVARRNRRWLVTARSLDWIS